MERVSGNALGNGGESDRYRFDARRFADFEALLTWVYRDQKADLIVAQGAGLHDVEAAADGQARFASSADGCAAVAKIGALGVRVDGGGSLAGRSGALNPLAEYVHEVIGQTITGRMAIEYARSDNRPDAMVGKRARFVPDPSRKYIYDDRGRACACRVVRIGPGPDQISMARRFYAEWWRAVHAARGRLEAAGVACPAFTAPAEPWAERGGDLCPGVAGTQNLVAR